LEGGLTHAKSPIFGVVLMGACKSSCPWLETVVCESVGDDLPNNNLCRTGNFKCDSGA